MSKIDRKTPTPQTTVTGECHWEHVHDESYLVDEAGVVWQTHWRGAPADTYAGSVQRHETLADNW